MAPAPALPALVRPTANRTDGFRSPPIVYAKGHWKDEARVLRPCTSIGELVPVFVCMQNSISSAWLQFGHQLPLRWAVFARLATTSGESDSRLYSSPICAFTVL